MEKEEFKKDDACVSLISDTGSSYRCNPSSLPFLLECSSNSMASSICYSRALLQYSMLIQEPVDIHVANSATRQRRRRRPIGEYRGRPKTGCIQAPEEEKPVVALPSIPLPFPPTGVTQSITNDNYTPAISSASGYSAKGHTACSKPVRLRDCVIFAFLISLDVYS